MFEAKTFETTMKQELSLLQNWWRQ